MVEKKPPRGETEERPVRVSLERKRGADFTSVYANLVQMRLGAFDFRMSFGVGADIDSDDNVLKMNEKVEIIVSPQHAKALLAVLERNVARYEAEFGPINYIGKSQGNAPDVELEVHDVLTEATPE